MARLVVVPAEALADRAADRLTALIEQSIAARGSATVSLTGGTTPRATYEALADPARPWRGRIDWPRVHLFWSDERHVPPDHSESNFGMANRAFVARVPIPAANVHRILGELPDPWDAARAYQEELHRGFAAAGRENLTFDVMLLGLGADAHIASIFPDTDLVHADGALTAAVFVAHLNSWRITLTPPAILNSQAIVMLVAGANKAAAVEASIESPPDIEHIRAQLLRQADDRVQWLLDREAASQLHRIE